uniref:Uncharacterized protein n=1 Tax=Cyprinus carpio carpio TaxID=630221 RepID=A0A9J7YC57_CYPCA
SRSNISSSVIHTVHFRSPLCLSISLYVAYALLYHPRHKDVLFLCVFSFDLKKNPCVTGLPVFIQNILDCLPKMNGSFTGLKTTWG